MGHIGIVLNKLSANNGEMSGHLYCVAKALCFVSGVLTSLAREVAQRQGQHRIYGWGLGVDIWQDLL